MNKDPIITIQQLKQQHMDQVAHLMTKSFLFHNKVWKHYQLPYQDVVTIMRGKLIHVPKNQQSFVMKVNNKIISAITHIQLLDYLKQIQMPHNLQFFHKLKIVGSVLQKDWKFDNIQRGTHIYGLYGVTDPQYMQKGYSFRFMWQVMLNLKAVGYRWYYGRASSQYSIKILKKLGAQVIGQVQLTQDGTPKQFWMIRVDLSKQTPSYSQLKKMMNLSEVKPKL